MCPTSPRSPALPSPLLAVVTQAVMGLKEMGGLGTASAEQAASMTLACSASSGLLALLLNM